MIKQPSNTEIKTLREFLDENGFSSDALIQRLGTAYPPTRDNHQQLLYLTREATTANALVRLFLMGASLDEAAAQESLPGPVLENCLTGGLLRKDGGRIRGGVVIVPVDDLLFASDPFDILGTDDAAEFVLPASTHSANYLRQLTMRSHVDNTLDLGCGCGIHALFAAKHSERVVATDISEAAVRYTEFNAALNDISNVECLAGDLFEPVKGRKFDLIVSNPPFVIGPGEEFVYRDNQLQLDEFCRLLVRETPEYLVDHGYLQMLFESVEIDGQSWPERLREWVTDTSCDAWILHSPPILPPAYVAQRSSDITADADADTASADDWHGYFAANDVTGVHPGMIVLRRRDGKNWFHLHNLTEDIEQGADDAVRRGIDSCDLLDKASDDEILLGSTLRIAPELKLQQEFDYADGGWQVHSSLLRMAHGLPMDAEVDLPIMAFLNQLNGQNTLQETLSNFSQAVGAEPGKLTADLMPIIRMFIGRGFIEPA